MFTTPHPPASPEELLKLCNSFRTRARFFNQVKSRFKASAADIKLITKFYDFNAALFRGKRRHSGGSFMNGHLVPVAILLMEYWQVTDPDMIAAALGHDSIEDFRDSVTRKIIEQESNAATAHLVCGMTKPPLRGRKKRSVEYTKAIVRKTAHYGHKVVFMKCCADRPQNMITLWGTPEKKRYKIWETEQYIIPLARSFGLPTAELQQAIAMQRERLHIDDWKD